MLAQNTYAEFSFKTKQAMSRIRMDSGARSILMIGFLCLYAAVCDITCTKTYISHKLVIEANHGTSAQSVTVNWLWIRFRLEEIKYLISSISFPDNEAKRGVQFLHSTPHHTFVLGTVIPLELRGQWRTKRS